MEYGLGAWLPRLGLVLSFAAVNLGLAFVIFLSCPQCFLHASIFCSLDPCVVAVSGVLLKVIFVRNGSLCLSFDLIKMLIVSLILFVL